MTLTIFRSPGLLFSRSGSCQPFVCPANFIDHQTTNKNENYWGNQRDQSDQWTTIRRCVYLNFPVFWKCLYGSLFFSWPVLFIYLFSFGYYLPAAAAARLLLRHLFCSVLFCPVRFCFVQKTICTRQSINRNNVVTEAETEETVQLSTLKHDQAKLSGKQASNLLLISSHPKL